ncbi:TraX family protein [Anaerotignum sp.]|uniref:TraX family protein n=1 Tax=Anaerotignum sp. TaxID=2039241 RepID=UPI002A914CA6|nr:TraX family protein [Anaerotignum sp.]MCI7656468.1 conjugal transfer protein TraX [Clostridia bacterium]MDY5416221.1 TraX family protein [Anaerotignum sp.]
MGENEILLGKAGSLKGKILDGTTIKLLAAFLMVLDHIHQMFAYRGAPMWLTMAGRVVFPLFLFAAAESFHYTRDRKKYLLRLLLASWFMTISSFFIQWLLPNDHVVLMNNAFSTFFVTAVYMLSWDWLKEGVREKRLRLILKAVLAAVIPVVFAIPMLFVGMLSANENMAFSTIRALATLSLLLPNILTIEGGVLLVALGVVFYIFRQHRWIQIGALVLLSGFVFYRDPADIQWMMVFAAVPMALYNGSKGKGLKHFFYIFYPAHIYLLYILSSVTAG